MSSQTQEQPGLLAKPSLKSQPHQEKPTLGQAPGQPPWCLLPTLLLSAWGPCKPLLAFLPDFHLPTHASPLGVGGLPSSKSHALRLLKSDLLLPRPVFWELGRALGDGGHRNDPQRQG